MNLICFRVLLGITVFFSAIGTLGCSAEGDKPEALYDQMKVEKPNVLAVGPNEILGIPIAVEGRIKECERTGNYGWNFVYRPEEEQSVLPCYAYLVPGSDAPGRPPRSELEAKQWLDNIPKDGARVEFYLDWKKIPKPFFMPNVRTISGLIVENKIEEVLLSTGGRDVQDQVMDLLKQNFGEPTESTSEDFRTRDGQVHENLWVIWRFANYTVYYLAMENYLNVGKVMLRTTKAQDYADREEAKKPKL